MGPKSDVLVRALLQRTSGPAVVTLEGTQAGLCTITALCTAMVNETMCKVLCHNLVVLIREMHELGIEPVFWSESA